MNQSNNLNARNNNGSYYSSGGISDCNSETRSMSGLNNGDKRLDPLHGLLQRIARSKSDQDNIDKKLLREV
jgi:hypothetical protein